MSGKGSKRRPGTVPPGEWERIFKEQPVTEQHDDFIDMMYGRLYLDRPVFNLEDIAHGLSMCCRFTGRIKRFYSIANHSLLVSAIMESRGDNPLEGLLHDAAEQAMSDLASPIKRRPELDGYREFEDRLEDALRKQFGLGPKTRECKFADMMAVWLEARELMPGGGADWVYPPQDARAAAEAWHSNNSWPLLILRETPLLLKQPFLDRYKELTA